MATYDFNLNRDQVIKGALRKLGVISEGQTPSTAQIDDCAEALNVLVKAWQAEGLPLWAIKQTSFTPTTSVAKYTVGTGQTVAVAKPLKVYQMWLRDNTSSVDIPMYLLTQQQYNILGNKTSTGTPTQFYYENLNTTGNLYLFPTPDSVTAAGKTVYLQYQAPFADFDSSTDVPDFPQEWIRALVYGLAADLSFDFGYPRLDRQELIVMAEKFKEEALAFTQEEGSLFFQIDTHRR